MNARRVANSITTRLILFGVVIALVTAAGRYFMMADFLREELEKVVSAQQEALAGYVARDIDFKITQRQNMLAHLARDLPLELLERPEALRDWLRQRHDIQPLFSRGFFVTDAQGLAFADYPPLPGRVGTSYADRDYFQTALLGASAVGRAIKGRAANEPVVPMAAPVKNGQGQVVAVLVGITATAAPGFLDLLQQVHIGESGGFLLVDPKAQIFVAATQMQLALQATAAPGVNPLHDKALQGWRGSGITVNAQGVEEIAATASVPSTGWFVVARLPTDEAFSIVKRAQSYVLRNASVMIVLFLVILVLALKRLFRPLASAADHAERMTRGELPLAPLPVQRDDEVGHLTAAFNRLIEKLMRSQADLALMAHHDALTGLPNRLLLADRVRQTLARAERQGTGLAVLFMDLDGFKPINDRFGHEAGDQALIEIARRLAAVVRESDTLARVGGDEFVVVIGDLDLSIEAAQLAASAVAVKCLEVVSEPMVVHAEAQTIGLSIGIALGTGSSSFDALLSAADTAMYRAKQDGKGKFVFAPTDHA